MPRQTWIADELIRWGLHVVTDTSWTFRGSTSFEPSGVLIHHTGGARGSDAPSLSTVKYGRRDLAPPLCAVLIGRSGRCHVIAAGRANHAGEGGPLPGVPLNGGNRVLFGVEAENDGLGEPWPDFQVAVMVAVTAALLSRVGSDASWGWGHKEYAPGRKPDPFGIDMGDFRGRVSRCLGSGPKATALLLRTWGQIGPASEEDDEMRIMAHQAIEEIHALYRKFFPAIVDLFPDEEALEATYRRDADIDYWERLVTNAAYDEPPAKVWEILDFVAWALRNPAAARALAGEG
jgi:hypothetical protein